MIRATRSWVWLRVVMVLSCVVAMSNGQLLAEAQAAATIRIGATPLSLVTQARRTHLLGAVDLYDLVIYLPENAPLRPSLLDSAVPKALHIQVQAPDDLAQRLTLDWRAELVPRLNAAGSSHLRNAVGSLRKGDLLMVEYSPELGTTVKVNKMVAVPSASHDLMLAFLDHWLGQRPVSEDIKRQLLGPS